MVFLSRRVVIVIVVVLLCSCFSHPQEDSPFSAVAGTDGRVRVERTCPSQCFVASVTPCAVSVRTYIKASAEEGVGRGARHNLAAVLAGLHMAHHRIAMRRADVEQMAGREQQPSG